MKTGLLNARVTKMVISVYSVNQADSFPSIHDLLPDIQGSSAVMHTQYVHGITLMGSGDQRKHETHPTILCCE